MTPLVHQEVPPGGRLSGPHRRGNPPPPITPPVGTQSIQARKRGRYLRRGGICWRGGLGAPIRTEWAWLYRHSDAWATRYGD